MAMTYGEIYLDASGRAYQRGYDAFEEIMPRRRAYALIRAMAETRPHVRGRDIADTLIMLVGRQLRRRARRAKRAGCAPDCPLSAAPCSWRKRPDMEHLRHLRPGSGNGVRAEAMSPSQRCGHRLRDGWLGGHWGDYNDCLFPAPWTNKEPSL